MNKGLHRSLVMTVVLAVATLPSCADAGHETPDRPPIPAVSRISFQGDRSIIGTVRHVGGEQIEVDVGELQPLFLPLRQAQEKGFDSIKAGDRLRIELNDQNLLVDFHPVDQKSVHRVVKGRIAQPLLIGHDEVVIRTENGHEEMYAIRPAARSKMSSLHVGTEAAFLLDETRQIVDVARDHGQDTHRTDNGLKSPPKGAHQRIQGTIIEPLAADRVRIRMENGKELRLEVRPMAQDRLNRVDRGETVILLVDADNKVIDVAIPPGRG